MNDGEASAVRAHEQLHGKPQPLLGQQMKIAPMPDAADTQAALVFIRDLAAEELPYAKVGTGAEVVLRHILRRAMAALGPDGDLWSCGHRAGAVCATCHSELISTANKLARENLDLRERLALQGKL